ncbi:McrB family protein [Microbacterium sp.]|uniref:McrB family protein n=1 Tax=Microbacterium sp. TaxID=51671 RepID=UPI00391B283D
MPIRLVGVLSLTKFYRFPDVIDELATLVPGVTTGVAVQALPALGPLWNDVVEFDPRPVNARTVAGSEVVVDDELLRAARAGREDRWLLLWCALLIADHRMEAVVREVLTDGEGRFVEGNMSGDGLAAALTNWDDYNGNGTRTPTRNDKPITNMLRFLADGGVMEPEEHGKSIVGVRRLLPTAHAVPGLLRLLQDRVDYWGDSAAFQPASSAEIVDFALALGSNRWLGLTREEFTRAARGPGPVTAPTPRRAVPQDLVELHELLETKRQVVLQGPPGTGKTYLAKAYIDWSSSGRREDSRLQTILDNLPLRERTPQRIADEVERLGLSALWEIVQFHPSYEYNDFVRTLAAEPVPGGVTFVPRHRILSLIAAVGAELETRNSDCELILVLDEVNRGNIPSIFGELLYALEYRGQPVATAYSVDGDASIAIPERLSVIGTMNTADRSIAVIDYALRRRFVFLTVPASSKPIDQHPGYASPKHRGAARRLFDVVHDALGDSASGIQVGPSYYLPSRTGVSEDLAVRELASRFIYEVLPLLDEYVLEGELDYATLTSLLGEVGVNRDDATAAQVDALQAALLV